MRCLVIEDSGRVRDIVVAVAGGLGFEAHGALNLEEGLKLLTELEPDFLVLDWDLPKQGALDVLTHTADAFRKRPQTILLATENDPRRFALARAAGAGTYVLKPFQREELEAAFLRLGYEKSAAA